MARNSWLALVGLGFAALLVGAPIRAVAGEAVAPEADSGVLGVHHSDWHLIELNELMLDYKNYALVNPNAHNMLIWPEVPKEGVNLTVKLDLFKFGYWDSTVESLTDDAKYQGIGLETRLGIRASEHLEVGFYHHSQHVLDTTYTYMGGHFPEEDALELRLYLFRSSEKRAGIF